MLRLESAHSVQLHVPHVSVPQIAQHVKVVPSTILRCVIRHVHLLLHMPMEQHVRHVVLETAKYALGHSVSHVRQAISTLVGRVVLGVVQPITVIMLPI